VVVPLFFLGLSNHGLWSADEPRVAEIGREMALTGNWAVPTLNQKAFLEEPPLSYGFLALTFKAFGGASDKVARIPSALFAFASVIVVFFIANFLFGPRIALLSGIILATAEEYLRVSHWVLVDSTLTFFVFCTMGFFIKGYLSENIKRKLFCYILLYISCTLAFFTKGFIGIVIPGLSILTFLIVEKSLKEILKMRLWLGILIFIMVALPWFIALWHRGGAEYLNDYLIHNQLERFLPTSMAWSTSGGFSGHRPVPRGDGISSAWEHEKILDFSPYLNHISLYLCFRVRCTSIGSSQNLCAFLSADHDCSACRSAPLRLSA
jgi:4-amino-4-deoxy-L-arabinose transferase-like glycosyltransferase